MAGPGYTVSDLVYWSGLFLGVIIAFVGGRHLGITNHIVLLVAGLALGVPLGMVFEKAYRGGGPPPPEDLA